MPKYFSHLGPLAKSDGRHFSGKSEAATTGLLLTPQGEKRENNVVNTARTKKGKKILLTSQDKKR